MDNDLAVLRLLGLGARGRLVVVGVDLTRKAVMNGKVKLAIVASDASRNSQEKITPLLLARGVSIINVASATALGGAVGRDTTVVVGVLDDGLARGIRAAESEIRRTG